MFIVTQSLTRKQRKQLKHPAAGNGIGTTFD
jgi:hypothetical protein